MVLAPPPPGVPGEGPDCNFPSGIVGLGPFPAQIRGLYIFNDYGGSKCTEAETCGIAPDRASFVVVLAATVRVSTPPQVGAGSLSFCRFPRALSNSGGVRCMVPSLPLRGRGRVACSSHASTVAPAGKYFRDFGSFSLGPWPAFLPSRP